MLQMSCPGQSPVITSSPGLAQTPTVQPQSVTLYTGGLEQISQMKGFDEQLFLNFGLRLDE